MEGADSARSSTSATNHIQFTNYSICNFFPGLKESNNVSNVQYDEEA